jgi:hypothetical protein
MTIDTTAQLAKIRRQELIADATFYRQVNGHRGRRPGSSSSGRNQLRRPIAAFHAWLAAGQL